LLLGGKKGERRSESSRLAGIAQHRKQQGELQNALFRQFLIERPF